MRYIYMIPALVTAALLVSIISFSASSRDCMPQWPYAGYNLSGIRYQPCEIAINPYTVRDLRVKWVFTTVGPVIVTPTVSSDGIVYFPDMAGFIYAVNASNGRLIWSRLIPTYYPMNVTLKSRFTVRGSSVDISLALDSELVIVSINETLTYYFKINPPISLTSPAIYGDLLIFGDTRGYVIAVNRYTGSLVWITRASDHPLASVQSSPVVYNGVVYVGVGDTENFIAIQYPTNINTGVFPYPCCTHRGEVVALNASNGRIIWRTYTAPPGYSGAAPWAPLSLDPGLGLLFVPTSNDYSVPPSIMNCVRERMRNGSSFVEAYASCTSPEDYFDSLLALNISNGKVVWAFKPYLYDTWNLYCWVTSLEALPIALPITMQDRGLCPYPVGKDTDMGSQPNVFTITINGTLRRVVGIGQKSGVYWLLDARTGKLIWATKVGPSGIAGGGMKWGTATDGEKIYVAIVNSDRKPWRLRNGENITWGFWAALNATNGEIIWEVPNPMRSALYAPVSVANGVVFGASSDPLGYMYALDANTGEILWSYPSGGSVASAPSIVNGALYWGSGFIPTAYLTVGTPNNRVYAFEVKGSGENQSPLGKFIDNLRSIGASIVKTVIDTAKSVANTAESVAKNFNKIIKQLVK